MNWWSVICKAPIDLRQAGYNLHATRMEDMEDDFNRDIASFTGKLISGMNTDAVDLSMVGYSATGTKEILLYFTI